ncbi:hypothetical protein BUALT_Bualt13G0035900 [Buddleja alternifolia]|uniref:Alkyl transferase n=1 Tax=Buddleja alternifolia TaxID=168488 RepID=A0AAV6WLH7_9LAMI|nr:hypothetical protein BUALT_Bualt13G0035900 [Buddleja alternifolia]
MTSPLLPIKTLPSSSLKPCSPQKKTNGNRPNIFEYFSPACSPISKSRLAAASNSIENIETDQKSSIQMPGDLRPVLMPKHVAVILDGHGRWAKNRGLPIEYGHSAGVENLKQLVSNCRKVGIKVLTVYAFSTENWKRRKGEVDFLMSTYEDFIKSFVKEQIMGQDLRFSVIGDKSRLPQSLQITTSSAEESAKTNRGMHFVMALSYGGRYDIIEASKKIASKVEHGILRAKDINESIFEQQLLTNIIAEFPNPDMLIRTSGELRTSNFLLWQLAYAEFHFPNKLFPDFKEVDLIQALSTFERRQRRYGGRKN